MNTSPAEHEDKENTQPSGLQRLEGAEPPGKTTLNDGHTYFDPQRSAMISQSPEQLKRETSTRSPSDAARNLRLSSQQIDDLTQSPGSLPLRVATPVDEHASLLTAAEADRTSAAVVQDGDHTAIARSTGISNAANEARARASRSVSSPVVQRKQSSHGSRTRPPLPHLKLETGECDRSASQTEQSGKPDFSRPSPVPVDLPIPPLSLPTYLQLELATSRPSPLYIHHNPAHDFPYESSEVKFERLLNFFRLPPQLEQVLIFGTLACLDSWLYTFTILPLRFFNANVLLLKWLSLNLWKEARDMLGFIYEGLGRVYQRRRQSTASRRPSMSDSDRSRRPSMTSRANSTIGSSARSPQDQSMKKKPGFRHRRTKSTPSTLLPNHKADILQGLLIILTCIALMWLDASRMYHSIRGQAAIKLYVIYNVLEVFDRLFSALGQDVLECLFSKETLERGPDGRSKIARPFSMFLLALMYNIVHATALFYQLVTLNVAVNSYSNALLTLLMSNQFVEIKGTVFKKFEKENLFQMTCADVVERFQLWVMLLIIALRNIVEVGGFNMSFASASFSNPPSPTTGPAANATLQPGSGSVIPNAFTLMPAWTGEVIGPFLIVLGSEMLVDWLKHAYITKFNNVKPNIYGRFLDVLTKDYYSHAFADQNLTKRLGLPVIPLSCLFIRASVQTYHMFFAIHVAPPLASTATAVSLETDPASTTPATMRALQHIDSMLRKALGQAPAGNGSNMILSVDDIIAVATMAMFFLALYLLLLASKLVLGMGLLSYSRNRYRNMKQREHQPTDAKGRRLGGWGVIEVGEDKRRWIYEDDKDALKELQAKEAKNRARAEKGEVNLDNIDRYMMAAKRIW